ncbi:MAG: MerR family transcriptional regulator [Pseudomonadota bacterium]
MSKSATAFRTISEVAELLQVPKHVLRFWELKFPQIKPMKRGGGRRYYRPEDLDLLGGIQHLLHAEGYTIKGVQKILREQGVEAVKSAPPSSSPTGQTDQSTKTAKQGRITAKSSSKSIGAGNDLADKPAKASATSRRKAAAASENAASRQHKPDKYAVGSAAVAVNKAIKELEECRSLLLQLAQQPKTAKAGKSTSAQRKRPAAKAARAS